MGPICRLSPWTLQHHGANMSAVSVDAPTSWGQYVGCLRGRSNIMGPICRLSPWTLQHHGANMSAVSLDAPTSWGQYVGCLRGRSNIMGPICRLSPWTLQHHGANMSAVSLDAPTSWGQYVGCLPGRSNIMGPICRLSPWTLQHHGANMSADCHWQLGEEQETGMSQLKKLVTTAPLLAHYDPAMKFTTQCAASSTGLGAALMQEGKSLAYTSRALSDTEAFLFRTFPPINIWSRNRPIISRLRPLSRNPCTNHRRDSKACYFDYFNMSSKSPITLLILYLELISSTETANKDSAHRSSICLSDERHRRNYAMQLTHHDASTQGDHIECWPESRADVNA